MASQRRSSPQGGRLPHFERGLVGTMVPGLQSVSFVGSTSPWSGWLCAIVGWGLALLGLVYLAFWLWMLWRCLLKEPDRWFWLGLLLLVPFPGAVVYALVRVFPELSIRPPAWFRKLIRRRELARLATAASQIGNAHQFVQWGDALLETGQTPLAAEAYAHALRKDPQSLPALWGAAQTAELLKQPADVVRFCRLILELDPQYKFGDVSLTYARYLKALGEHAAAREHLEHHCRRWRHPEAVYLLAELCLAAGEAARSRKHLEELLRDLSSCPPALARRFGRWRTQASQLLKRLSDAS